MMTLSSAEKDLLGRTFQWKWNIDEKLFYSEPLLKIIFGPENSGSVRFRLLVDLLDANQATYFKKNIETSISSQDVVTSHLVFTIANVRYLVEVTIYSSNLKLVAGSMLFKRLLPSKQKEASILKKLFYQSSRLLFVCDDNNQILMINQMLVEYLGYEEYEVVGQKISAFIHDKNNVFQEYFFNCEANGTWDGELFFHHKDGSFVAFKANILHYSGSNKSTQLNIFQLSKLDFIFSDIVEYSQQKPNWDWNNKVDFFDELNDMRALRSNQESLVVFVIDTYFHSSKNSISPRWLLGQSLPKLKGFQHIVKLGLLNDEQICGAFISSKLVKTIHSDLAEIFDLLLEENQLQLEHKIRCNIGVSIDGVDAQSNEQLLSNTLQALTTSSVGFSYVNEHKVKYFNPKINIINNRKLKLESALKSCLEHEQIYVVYQPIINLKTLKIDKVEALARFNINTTVHHSIQELIDLAEENDWINIIDKKVLLTAISELPALATMLGNENLGLSINRSMINSSKNRFTLDDTVTLINSTGIDPRRITIELTESAVCNDNQSILDDIKHITDNDIVLAIDDFGSGYTSFTDLSVLPLNLIKINKFITDDIVKDKQKRLMVKMFTQFIHSMGGEIVIEGVEGKEVLKALVEMGVNYVQGYIFSKPLSLMEHSNTVNDINVIIDKLQLKLLVSDMKKIPTVTDFLMPAPPHVEPDDRIEMFIDMFESSDMIMVLSNTKCVGYISQNDVNAAISPYVNTNAETKHDRLTMTKRAHQISIPVEYTCYTDYSVESLLKHFCLYPQSVMVVTGKTGIFLGAITIEQVKGHLFKMIQQ
ncbi:sensor domain-containing phosphodiesterase [Shewanella saliphila]|nr:EAL domain-containing protein [Shewanella saliphila]MCL1101324.1 EAL domain-containing protein [Shewanella saliphila]